ncbi:Cthe_2314 family HEPN domain-containing protein [Chitinophaga solisilvae]|uniref:Cthe_2314 family HEPN domain-containing protein n=1 Tax=Chitinophaga solisilvae TaxID=1233460 RepID=UPI00136CBD3E|nr:Cthe_2314 family HEPN domain-containing protein [Chitinophaga solisilvae]
MEELKAFHEWNDQIFKEQKEQNLVDLHHTSHYGKSSASIFSDVLFNRANSQTLPYSLFKLHDEFISISKDIKYITAILFLLRPHIINPKENEGKYLQNLEDRRYLMYTTFGIQAIYNFWDRLGDLLHLYFRTNIRLDKVTFGRMKDLIPDDLKSKTSYLRLIELYDEQKSIFDLRHDAVHHYQVETQQFWGVIENREDPEKIDRLNKEKEAYPEKMKHALEICNVCFYLALEIIAGLPIKED